MTNCYEQKSPLRSIPKQTQSKPIKPYPASVFGPKIGFEHSKPASRKRSCVCFLPTFTEKYTLLEKLILSFNPFSRFERGILFKYNPVMFPSSQRLNEQKLMAKPLSLKILLIDQTAKALV